MMGVGKIREICSSTTSVGIEITFTHQIWYLCQPIFPLGNLGLLGEFCENLRNLKETRGNSGKLGDTQGNSGKLRETQGKSKNFLRVQGSPCFTVFHRVSPGFTGFHRGIQNFGDVREGGWGCEICKRKQE